jgi:hypothetical protein
VSYQSDQKKLVQRWLNSCSKESRDINEDVAGLEASDAEYKKVQVVITSEIKRMLVYTTNKLTISPT